MGCRVVVQGGGCCCRDCWRGKPWGDKRYGQRGCLREASGKSLRQRAFVWVFLEEGFWRGSSRARILERGAKRRAYEKAVGERY